MKWSREDYTGSAVETAKHLIGAVDERRNYGRKNYRM